MNDEKTKKNPGKKETEQARKLSVRARQLRLRSGLRSGKSAMQNLIDILSQGRRATQ